MSKNFRVTIILLFFIIFTSCGLQSNESINGKYVSAFDDTIYYNFTKDKNYSTNNIEDYYGNKDNSSGTYDIQNNEIILYINGDENATFNLGYVYKNYICSLWDGSLPKDSMTNAKVSINLSGALLLEFRFNADGTYNFMAISNNEEIDKSVGVYSVYNGKVVCIDSNGKESTFINADSAIYGIEFIKE